MKNNLEFEYRNIVKDILEHDEFAKMADIEHHNSTRLSHLMKVSYYSYVVAKGLKLKYREVARAGLLHDFYFGRTTDHSKLKDKIKLYTHNHPKEAVENARKYFYINNMEADIIESHMFPIDIKIPKYLESWIVSTVDKVVATHEFYCKASKKLKYSLNLGLVLVLNVLK